MGAEQIPAVGFVAPSGSGKTTLLRKLVPLLRQRGLRIGYLKHAHHGFALDRPGKDSYEVAAAGARQVMLVSGEHWALLSRTNERAEDHPAGLDALRARFDAGSLDLLLIEGFRSAAVPKIEVFRAATGKTPLYPDDDGIVAVVSDDPLPIEPHPPVLPLSDPQALADFIGKLVRDSAVAPEDPRVALVQHLQRLRAEGDIGGLAGNASVRQGKRFWITPSGASLDALVPDDLVACALDAPLAEAASLDAPIHREVYRQQPEIGSVLHSHGPHSVAISFAGRDFEPLDFGGARLFGSVPVLRLDPGQHRDHTPARVAEALASHSICIVAGHGIYACGAKISDAQRRTMMLELSARIAVITRAASTR
ncbi:MAG: molybdopterin-guanine dinucleotide biosynthesis protein B [Chromatiaceae bacterium]|nr:molybdopterin-guanine dinucleotide biosynthesis protein B [Chromatiaceae bacterium]MCF8003163.1 molybdopterin-guanine dinucleotide biosynthesis protein B [Chromatiaceae bacterium]MCF8015560.1 molybdopterin-guanine dinucleotide biosynthesis protein B [Chromatiaceae bacterium]